MKVKLSYNEMMLLLRALKLTDDEVTLKFEKINEDSYALNLSPQERSDLRDDCGDYLENMGLDENFKPNNEGIAVENLIEKLL
jgi:hypothetical protein